LLAVFRGSLKVAGFSVSNPPGGIPLLFWCWLRLQGFRLTPPAFGCFGLLSTSSDPRLVFFVGLWFFTFFCFLGRRFPPPPPRIGSFGLPDMLWGFFRYSVPLFLPCGFFLSDAFQALVSPPPPPCFLPQRQFPPPFCNPMGPLLLGAFTFFLFLSPLTTSSLLPVLRLSYSSYRHRPFDCEWPAVVAGLVADFSCHKLHSV